MQKIKQLVTSAGTSLNQVAATFRKVSFNKGSKNLDFGGGRYDKASLFLAGLGVENIVYDPFNRSPAHNLLARLSVARSNGADTVTANNLLNVIPDRTNLDYAILQIANACKPDGAAYFLIHEGDKSGVPRQTPRGWQENKRASEYVEAVSAHFGVVSRKGNLLIAKAPVKSHDHGIFSEGGILADAIAAAKRAGIPQRPASTGVGKLIGGCLYVHRDYEDGIPADLLSAAKKLLPAGSDYTVVKWNKASGDISLIASPDFDSSHEPIVGDAFKVSPDGSVKTTKMKADPQIYHHKWNFVRDGHKGFDTLESVIRSLSWNEIPCDKSRIGTLSYWKSNVLCAIEQKAKQPEPTTRKGARP